MNSYKTLADVLANNPEMTNAVESAVNELYGTGNQSYSMDEPAAPNAAAAYYLDEVLDVDEAALKIFLNRKEYGF